MMGEEDTFQLGDLDMLDDETIPPGQPAAPAPTPILAPKLAPTPAPPPPSAEPVSVKPKSAKGAKGSRSQPKGRSRGKRATPPSRGKRSTTRKRSTARGKRP